MSAKAELSRPLSPSPLSLPQPRDFMASPMLELMSDSPFVLSVLGFCATGFVGDGGPLPPVVSGINPARML